MIKKTKLIILVILFSFSTLSIAEHPMLQAFGKVGEVAFTGDTTLGEMLLNLPTDKFMGKNDVIKIEVRMPIVQDSKQLVANLDSLPMDRAKMQDEEHTLTKADLYVPLEYSVFLKSNAGSDIIDFADYIDSMLNKLTIPSADDDMTKSRLANASNCGGFSLGTTYTYSFTSCLGSTTTELTCQTNARTGGNDWFITGQTYTPPASGCLGTDGIK
ncbi:MAG: hypothetical protein L3J53_02910 [Proteobacteria bacterium]|nr:hypothetical protein [Pseudomonadota bacterium]